jgi:hypothetical protein
MSALVAVTQSPTLLPRASVVNPQLPLPQAGTRALFTRKPPEMSENIETRRDHTGFGPKLLDTSQVAEKLNVSESWVRAHSNPHGSEPRLLAMKLGEGKTACVRFHPEDIDAFIDEQRQSGRARGAAQSRWKH